MGDTALKMCIRDRFFSAGQSMHHIIFATLDRHGLDSEPRVTLAFQPQQGLVRIALGTTNLYFAAPQWETAVPLREAVPTVRRFLRHLWGEGKPGSPTPSVLDHPY